MVAVGDTSTMLSALVPGEVIAGNIQLLSSEIMARGMDEDDGNLERERYMSMHQKLSVFKILILKHKVKYKYSQEVDRW